MVKQVEPRTFKTRKKKLNGKRWVFVRSGQERNLTRRKLLGSRSENPEVKKKVSGAGHRSTGGSKRKEPLTFPGPSKKKKKDHNGQGTTAYL